MILNLVNAFREQYEITVLHGGSGTLARECPKINIKSIQVPIDRLVKCLWGTWVLLWRLLRLKPNIVFLHGQWAGPIGAVACRLAGIRKIVYVAHWPAFYHTGSFYRHLRGFWAEKIPSFLVKKIVVLSEGNRQAYLNRRLAHIDKFFLIHNCVSNENPSNAEIQAIRLRMQKTSRGPHVVFVGRLDEQKRPDWMLHTWAKVSEKLRKDSHLWIIGDGPLRQQLETLRTQLHLESSCSLIGSRSDGRSWLCAGDIVAMTSSYEGHALVPLEAMMGERPIAAFRVDGIEDSIVHEETGLLANVGETGELAIMLTQLLQNKEMRDAMGKKGNQRCLAHFSQEKWLAAYRQLLKTL